MSIGNIDKSSKVEQCYYYEQEGPYVIIHNNIMSQRFSNTTNFCILASQRVLNFYFYTPLFKPPFMVVLENHYSLIKQYVIMWVSQIRDYNNIILSFSLLSTNV